MGEDVFKFIMEPMSGAWMVIFVNKKGAKKGRDLNLPLCQGGGN